MSLFVECHNDEAVVHALGIPRRLVIHSKNKSGVAKRLAKGPEGCVGLIDEDPHDTARIPDFDPFQVLDRKPTFEVLKHRKLNKLLIRLKPRLEEWLIGAANASQVELSRFYLPGTASQLHLLKPEKGDRIGNLVKYLQERKCAAIVELGVILRERLLA